MCRSILARRSPGAVQQYEVIVAGNAEQVTNASLLETEKQEIADLHSSAGAARHTVRSFYLVCQCLRESSFVKNCSFGWASQCLRESSFVKN